LVSSPSSSLNIAPCLFLISSSLAYPYLHSFPTRRSSDLLHHGTVPRMKAIAAEHISTHVAVAADGRRHHRQLRQHGSKYVPRQRSEEHTSELQSRGHLVCRLLLEKKKKNKRNENIIIVKK